MVSSVLREDVLEPWTVYNRQKMTIWTLHLLATKRFWAPLPHPLFLCCRVKFFLARRIKGPKEKWASFLSPTTAIPPSLFFLLTSHWAVPTISWTAGTGLQARKWFSYLVRILSVSSARTIQTRYWWSLRFNIIWIGKQTLQLKKK